MKFSLYANVNKDTNGTFLNQVCLFIESLGSEVIHSELITKGGDTDTSRVRNSDIIITLGGDGTLLDIAQKTKSLSIPLVGINLGSLGFLTQIEKVNYKELIHSITKGQYSISKRSMLSAQILRDNEVISNVDALNDVVITRKITGDTAAVSVHINGSYIDTYDGDGVIISTPTGSTGYQMSAGGPVSDPEADIILMTPICPHMMHKQSYILKNDSCLELIVEENKDFECCFSYDGIVSSIYGKDIIKVKKSNLFIPLLKMQKNSFYENLRNKIYYRGN
ncbi:MAG: NAD(+)/NADH kinase [Clostridia bacterium]|jgi:NAD+ kinase|nr:NAD(+)/NADH kinase [Clostridiaceae bacterium]